MPKLYEMIENNAFDPTDIITHRVSLDEAAKAYDIFDKKEDGSIKIIFGYSDYSVESSFYYLKIRITLIRIIVWNSIK